MAADNTQCGKAKTESSYSADGMQFAGVIPGSDMPDHVAQNVWSNGGGSVEAWKAFGAGTPDVADRGPIDGIKLPDGWLQRETSFGGIGQRSNETFGPADDASTTLGILYNGLKVSEKAATAFKNLLQDKPADNGPQKLTASEIRALSQVMGRLQAGDNQYTNSGQYRKPTFDLEKAYTMKVNGKTVLAVEGSFVDARGNAVREYTGIFADSDGTGERVQQVFLSSAPGKLQHNAQKFRDTVNSIEWKQ